MIRSREDLAWAAGLFEGEGTICLRPQKTTHSLSVAVRMTDRDVVQRFADIMGFGQFRPGVILKSGKQMWTWESGKHECVQALVAMLWIWLGARRRQKAREVLMFAKENMWTYHGTNSPNYRRSARIEQGRYAGSCPKKRTSPLWKVLWPS